MNDRDELVRRLDDLEAHIAHQDSTIQDLNEVTLRQWKEIEALREQVARLTDRLEAVADAGETGSDPEPPPPHY